MRILVVEDDQLLNKTLSYNLSAVGYSVDGAMSKAVAIRFLEKQDYDFNRFGCQSAGWERV